MKKILITGKNSYVGNSFERWVTENYPGNYYVEKISLRDEEWENHDFSVYDVVLHVAGIAHRKETNENKYLFYEVNRDLAFKVAIKARNEGVTHFIHLSSMSVYGLDAGVITRDTVPKPKSHYGKSKLEAERLIISLNNAKFKIAILRPPMIYGKGCRGNYQKLSKFAKRFPLFPKVNNQRSMIYIDNLSLYLKYIIDNNKSGIFLPQNIDYVNTSELIKLISEISGKKIWITSLFNPIVYIMKNNRTFKKIFGSLVYEKQDIDSQIKTYNIIGFEESIRLTED